MKKNVVIIGGGTAGIPVMKNIHRRRNDVQITLIEPNETHYYQPLWTLVGGGVMPLSDTARKNREFIPEDVNWVKQLVTKVDAEANKITLEDGSDIKYDYLVVTPGIRIDWNKIEGLSETLGKNGVCSNYSQENVEYTWKSMNELKSGRALFTFPMGPIKCAGAPQKIMYLAEETFRDNGVRNQVEVKFVSAGAGIFGVKKYKDALEKVIDKRKINTLYKHNLVKIDGANKIATFKNLETEELHQEKFDMIHVSPPMSAPQFIQDSGLGNEAGWVDVDKHTTRHNKYNNIFSIGDASSLPNSKTGAAVRKQAPVLLEQLYADLDGQSSQASYNGYASCPLVTSRSTCILAEFDYDGTPQETFPFNQAKERKSMYFLKKNLLPILYWKGMMKGYF